MGSAWVTVASATLRHEAELIKLRLEATGIEAWLADEGVVGANPLLAFAVGGIKIRVNAEDEERARSALADMEDQPQREGVCLSCGASMSDSDESCAACGWTYLSDR